MAAVAEIAKYLEQLINTRSTSSRNFNDKLYVIRIQTTANAAKSYLTSKNTIRNLTLILYNKLYIESEKALSAQ